GNLDPGRLSDEAHSLVERDLGRLQRQQTLELVRVLTRRKLQLGISRMSSLHATPFVPRPRHANLAHRRRELARRVLPNVRALHAILANHRTDGPRLAARVEVSLQEQPQQLTSFSSDEALDLTMTRMQQVLREQRLLDVLELHV